MERPRSMQARGAGEIVLNCMASDGVRRGYDLEQLRAVREICNVPLVASGGAGAVQHFRDAFELAGVDAALAASVFHTGAIAVTDLKRELAASGVAIRPWTPRAAGGVGTPRTGRPPRGIGRDIGRRIERGGSTMTLSEADIAQLDFAKGAGLLPAVVQHAGTGAVLMVGFMNVETLRATLERRRGRADRFATSERGPASVTNR